MDIHNWIDQYVNVYLSDQIYQYMAIVEDSVFTVGVFVTPQNCNWWYDGINRLLGNSPWRLVVFTTETSGLRQTFKF